jgi:hypothetical protein
MERLRNSNLSSAGGRKEHRRESEDLLHEEHLDLEAGGRKAGLRMASDLNSVALSRAGKGFIISNLHKMLSVTKQVAHTQHFRLQRSWVIEANDLRLRFTVSMNEPHPVQSGDNRPC